jgi:hypothetical protein
LPKLNPNEEMTICINFEKSGMPMEKNEIEYDLNGAKTTNAYMVDVVLK